MLIDVMDYYGLLWIIMDYYGLLWILMDSYGSLWIILRLAPEESVTSDHSHSEDSECLRHRERRYDLVIRVGS